eukprot:1153930-Pelagomonas_calceolata.AAC.1
MKGKKENKDHTGNGHTPHITWVYMGNLHPDPLFDHLDDQLLAKHSQPAFTRLTTSFYKCLCLAPTGEH